MYWDTLTESDKKTWSNYMIHRFISMKTDWIEVANEIQRYWELKPKNLYQFYTDILPKGRTFLRYTKSKKKSKVEKWAMKHLVDYFECSEREVEEHLELLTKEQEGKLQKMINNMLDVAADVVKEYKDIDCSELQELSGSLTQINENSPFLDEIFEGDSWKRVVKNMPKKSKDEDAS